MIKTVPAYPVLRDVKLCDSRFAPWIEGIAKITVRDVLDKFESHGAYVNYDRVAEGQKGGHNGPPWYHGLVCETIRGVADLLVHHPNEKVVARIDSIIERMARAQAADPDNYINPYTTLECPNQRWGHNGGNILWQHETYNAGGLFEAAVHYYQATGKTNLLKVAVKMANYLASVIGDPPKKNVVAEHPLPEEALLSLYQLLRDNKELAEELGAQPEEYLRVARYMIDHKGDNENRYTYPKFLREYAQDHRPPREQREAVGHAVRATLFYSAMAAVGFEIGDEALYNASRIIWKDVVETKLHANGCVGTHRYEENFGHQYDLPNNAYLETCAGVGLIFWGANLFRIYPDAGIWDVLEGTIYNLLPASLSETFDHYTYENPLESRGDYNRWSWHYCPCCPPMLLKCVGRLPTYVFAQNGENVWVNLYIDSELERPECKIKLSGGKIKVLPKSESRVPLTFRLRVPEWSREFKLYLNGKECELCRDEGGYAVVSHEFGEGDLIEVKYSVPIVKYAAHPYVHADRGRVMIKHGPLLYCAESIDNGGITKWEDFDFVISESEPLTLNADGTITGKRTDGETLTLIPYYKWNNRGQGLMRVWFRQENLRSDPMDIAGWEGKLYRPLSEYPV